MTELQVGAGLKAQYDAYYEGASEWRRLGAIDKVDNIIRLATSVPHESILDIGCGEGSLLARLNDMAFGMTYHAVDISESAIAATERRALPKLEAARVFDGYRLPYEDQRFDLAILCHVVEHLEHPRQLLREAGRVARHVVVEAPLEHTWGLPFNYLDTGVGHINLYTARTLRWTLQTAGLTVDRERISLPSYAVHTFNGGALGAVRYGVKWVGLRVFPLLARFLWCYHAAFLCHATPR